MENLLLNSLYYIFNSVSILHRKRREALFIILRRKIMAANKNKIALRAEDLCTEIIESMGYDLVEVTYGKEGPDYHLTFYVDKRGGIGLDDCEKITLAIDPVLDENLDVPQSYMMSVSSPGLDRPLKSEKDFLRHIGDELEVSLYKQYKGEQKPCGILLSYDNGRISLELSDGDILTLEATEYSKVKQTIHF